jgi:hypothetical protein
MKNLQSFDNFLNEGSASMYKSTVQDALKLLGYNLKQSELKVGVKKEKLYDLITLNGELLCSSSDHAQMLTWIQNAVKEDPKKYGLDPKVLESTNEAMVQIAGDKKPSGAKVLAMVIVDKLESSGMLKPGANINAIKDAVQTIIMENTF